MQACLFPIEPATLTSKILGKVGCGLVGYLRKRNGKSGSSGLNGKRFPWGDTISHSQANYFSSVTLFYDVSPTRGFNPKFNNGTYPYTNPVGYFASNGYGLYDVTGNVWEWCWDWYVEINFDSSPANNPRGPTTGKGRTLRGGGLGGDAWGNGVGFRNGDGPINMLYSPVGFRTVLSVKTTAPITPTPDPIQTIKIQPKQPVYGICPVKEPEKKNIVVVTHGWQPVFRPVDIADTTPISQRLVKQGRTDWQVHAYRWVRGTSTYNIKPRGAQIALDNAKNEGVSFGKYALERFTHTSLTIGRSRFRPISVRNNQKNEPP